MKLDGKRILISKTNQIGDVIFALPLTSAIKKIYPTAQIIFLGREYTRALIEHYPDVDEFVDWQAVSELCSNRAVKTLNALNMTVDGLF